MSTIVRQFQDLLAAQEVLRAESETLATLAVTLDGEAFSRAVELLLNAPAHVVVTGIGKSGHIAAKVAATLASTGTPAFFLHAAEAVHGDLGMVTKHNVVLAFSQSGGTEILNLLPYIKRLEVPLIAITGNTKSELAERADVVLNSSVDAEACPLNLAPTSSTTAQLALGDALAVALMRRRGFTPDDFAMRHPLGALGRRLLMRVSDLMATGENIPRVTAETPLKDAIRVMSGKRLGSVCIVDANDALTGIFCDGDLGRLFDRTAGQIDVMQPISELMIKNPKNIQAEALGVKAVDLMETHKITVLPVIDSNIKLVGLIHLHVLIRAGIVT